MTKNTEVYANMPIKLNERAHLIHSLNPKYEVKGDELDDTEALTYANEIIGESIVPVEIEDSWLVKTVQEIISTVEKDLHESQFKFEDTMEGAEWNTKVLAKYDYDFEKAIKSEPNKILTPGSESLIMYGDQRNS